jgi:GrpB-like predicted nucleotidyltransferase (UPF0157 family)
MIGLERGKVRIVSYQAEWKPLFLQEAALLESILSDAILQIEHIGSTAIEGMAAKPIIDLMCVVSNLREAESFRAPIEQAGYEYRPDDAVPDRLFFAKGPRSNRTHHLSLTERGSDFYNEKLAFRNHIRKHPQAADEYRKLKERLAERFANDRGAYTEGKRAFVERILKLAAKSKDSLI